MTFGVYPLIMSRGYTIGGCGFQGSMYHDRPCRIWSLGANQVKGSYSEIEDGVKVIHRTDYNYQDAAAAIKDTVVKYASLTDKEVKFLPKSCRQPLSKSFMEQVYCLLS